MSNRNAIPKTSPRPPEKYNHSDNLSWLGFVSNLEHIRRDLLKSFWNSNFGTATPEELRYVIRQVKDLGDLCGQIVGTLEKRGGA
jgi:hypothetical protein